MTPRQFNGPPKTSLSREIDAGPRDMPGPSFGRRSLALPTSVVAAVTIAPAAIEDAGYTPRRAGRGQADDGTSVVTDLGADREYLARAGE
jgi:hypothetical protein